MDATGVNYRSPAVVVSENDVVLKPTEKDAAMEAADVAAPAYMSMVDPFLIEALQNPRHRVTVLRMELDIQKFFLNPNMQQFEFPHFPTSYLRLAAHRVAQHYGLVTMIQDNSVDGQGARILVRKKAESKYPAICLSDVPPKQSENDKFDQKKIFIRPRPRASTGESGDSALKHSPLRTVEERKEEYDRARARIFSSPNNSVSEESLVRAASDGKDTVVENECLKSSIVDLDKKVSIRGENGSSSRVAILRDREKDLVDPDYDRSYERYANKNVPINQSFNMTPFNIQNFQPYVQYDSSFPQLCQMPRTQASLNYRNPVPSPYYATGLHPTSSDAVYMQWPTQSMMYAHSYEELRHGVFQVPFSQQPLSFDYSQNHC
nr:cAMP-regulated phosphoprotein 21-like [Ipomoea batatas]GMD43050.1 cAMP-regulated phosphoprotein 21-like [Ipomoea batatas]GMD44816.1 cAMP-regulated phosphoprotein 21-like [Ipomoea batatas]